MGNFSEPHLTILESHLNTHWFPYSSKLLYLERLSRFLRFLFIMVATVAAAAVAFSPASSSTSSVTSPKVSGKLGIGSHNLDTKGLKPKSLSSSAAMQVKAKAQAVPKINGTRPEGSKVDDSIAPSYVPRTFYNQLPDWSVLLAAITTIFLAAEKQLTLMDWKPKRPDMISDAFGMGRIVEDGLVFRQSFSIRSYEIGADGTASIETLMNHLQETALNHVKVAGLLGDGFGSTPEMAKRNLIWVVSKMQLVVDRYPSWEDVVEVDTWVSPAGKNGMRREWHVRDWQTGQTVARARSVCVLMNKLTRRLSKMPQEVREEIDPYILDRAAIAEEDSRKLPKIDDDSADYIQKGLTPRWTDLDVNQHVNNVKYVGWLLQSAPALVVENHELAAITLEYRKECEKDSVLQSLTAISDCGDAAVSGIECQHLLRLESGAEILRARTEWRPKGTQDNGAVDGLLTEHA